MQDWNRVCLCLRTNGDIWHVSVRSFGPAPLGALRASRYYTDACHCLQKDVKLRRSMRPLQDCTSVRYLFEFKMRCVVVLSLCPWAPIPVAGVVFRLEGTPVRKNMKPMLYHSRYFAIGRLVARRARDVANWDIRCCAEPLGDLRCGRHPFASQNATGKA